MVPIVSVIMPAYRCAGTITAALSSALAQDVPLEVIVINDRSPDDLDAVMADYRADQRITYVTNEENIGPARSRNRGVAMARGKYVAFLDADDLWAAGKLRRQLELLERTGGVLCCTARELMTPDGKCTGRVLPVAPIITYRDLLKHNSIACSSVVMRTCVAREFPMRHADSHEDYIMWLEVLRKYNTAWGINMPLVKYRQSATGKSGSKWKSARMTFKVYRYMGFGLGKSLACFCSYAWNGFKKYYLGGKGDHDEI